MLDVLKFTSIFMTNFFNYSLKRWWESEDILILGDLFTNFTIDILNEINFWFANT